MTDKKGLCWEELEDLGLNNPDRRITYDRRRALDKQQHARKSPHPDAADREHSATATLYASLELAIQQPSEGGKSRATPVEEEAEWEERAIGLWAKNKHLGVREVARRIDIEKHETIRKKIAHLKPR